MLWKDGKKKALTLSYDDAVIHDRRFIRLLDKYGIKGTFNLNSECFEENPIFVEDDEVPVEEHRHRKIAPSEVKELYKNHEVASHSCTHPNLVGLPLETVKREIAEDICNLEKLSLQKVSGFAYPYGAYDEELEERLLNLGIVYGRTVHSTHAFGYPEKFIEWHPTCHHDDPKLMELANAFIESEEEGDLFYLWGHTYEFYINDNWDKIEEFLQLMAKNKDKIWFATNKEIYEYIEEHKQA